LILESESDSAGPRGLRGRPVGKPAHRPGPGAGQWRVYAGVGPAATTCGARLETDGVRC